MSGGAEHMEAAGRLVEHKHGVHCAGRDGGRIALADILRREETHGVRRRRARCPSIVGAGILQGRVHHCDRGSDQGRSPAHQRPVGTGDQHIHDSDQGVHAHVRLGIRCRDKPFLTCLVSRGHAVKRSRATPVISPRL